MTCARFELLARIPLPGLRLRLCIRHVDRCPRCGRASEGREALPSLLVSADQLPPGLDLWPAVRKVIMDPGQRTAGDAPAPPPAWRPGLWAYAAAMLLLALFIGFWALFLGRGTATRPGSVVPQHAARTQLHSARIADRPARVIQFQSRDPNRSIFWIAKEVPRS